MRKFKVALKAVLYSYLTLVAFSCLGRVEITTHEHFSEVADSAGVVHKVPSEYTITRPLWTYYTWMDRPYHAISAINPLAMIMLQGQGGLYSPSVIVGYEKLGCVTGSGTAIGPITIPVRKLLFQHVYIAGYSGGGDTAQDQFNASGGTAYRFRWLTSAAAATTFTAGASNVPTVSTSVIKLGPDNTTNSRNVEVWITNDSGVTEKLVNMQVQIGSGSAATQSALAFGNGAWVSGAATSITQVGLSTATTNMNAGSGFCIFGGTF